MIKKCAVCGTEFDSTNGLKYCSDSCRAEGLRISRIKYNAKQRAKKVTAITKSNIIDYHVETPKTFDKDNQAVIPCSNYNYTQARETPTTFKDFELETKQIELDYVTRSINALKNLDNAIRQVQDIIDVLKIEQNKYYKEDNEFAHIVEGSGSLTDMQKVKLVNDYQVKRSKRRNVKDIIVVLINCIRYAPHNSEKIIKDALQSKIKVDEFFRDYYKHRGV